MCYTSPTYDRNKNFLVISEYRTELAKSFIDAFFSRNKYVCEADGEHHNDSWPSVQCSLHVAADGSTIADPLLFSIKTVHSAFTPIKNLFRSISGARIRKRLYV